LCVTGSTYGAEILRGLPRQQDERKMKEQIFTLINRIKSIEQQIRDLNDERRGLEKELKYFSIGDDAVKDLRMLIDRNS
jgi:hypothetical protein